eukprot:2700301-Pyramimonas_sp.AAC.1
MVPPPPLNQQHRGAKIPGPLREGPEPERQTPRGGQRRDARASGTPAGHTHTHSDPTAVTDHIGPQCHLPPCWAGRSSCQCPPFTHLLSALQLMTVGAAKTK